MSVSYAISGFDQVRVLVFLQAYNRVILSAAPPPADLHHISVTRLCSVGNPLAKQMPGVLAGSIKCAGT